jgi:class 3 adenylate cyclase
MLIDAMRPFDLELRAGVHTGECERVGLDVAGMAVHVGARVEGQAKPGEVLVTRAARDLSQGAGLNFVSRGKTTLKGVPGRWELFGVTAAGDAEIRADPEQKLRLADRALLTAARRAPGLLRAASRLTQARR